MDKKIIYFHIGTHKTGSTAIQKFLKTNQEELKKKEIIYDFLTNGINHMNVSHDITKWDDIQLNNKYSYIFSSEDFYYHFFQKFDEPNLLKSLEYLSDSIDDFNIKVIVYLRRQDHFVQSIYNELIKRHNYYGKLKDNVVPLDYYKVLKMISDVIGKENIIVRPYEKEQFKNGNIYDDFLSLLNLDINDNYTIPSSVINPSLTRDKAEFSMYINALKLPEEISKSITQLVIRSTLDSKEALMFKEQDYLTALEATTLINQYSNGNKLVAQEFLNRKEGTLFYESLPNINENRELYPGLDKSVAKDIFQYILLHNHDVLLKLYYSVISNKSLSFEFVKASNFFMPILEDILNNVPSYTMNVFNQNSIENTESNTFINFSNLDKIISSSFQSADILREVAVAFEKTGDMDTAKKIMYKALQLRPNGRIIKEKMDYYTMQNELNEHN